VTEVFQLRYQPSGVRFVAAAAVPVSAQNWYLTVPGHAESLMLATLVAVLMGVLVVTGLYDITLVGPAPAWAGLGMAL
jgi:hypothetical protein